MAKMNCWEFKNCGRQEGGAKAAELGVCIASSEHKHAKNHGGVNSGRICWLIAGTLCGGKVQGTFAAKFSNCMACEFYKKVKAEEGKDFKMAKEIMES